MIHRGVFQARSISFEIAHLTSKQPSGLEAVRKELETVLPPSNFHGTPDPFMIRGSIRTVDAHSAPNPIGTMGGSTSGGFTPSKPTIVWPIALPIPRTSRKDRMSLFYQLYAHRPRAHPDTHTQVRGSLCWNLLDMCMRNSAANLIPRRGL